MAAYNKDAEQQVLSGLQTLILCAARSTALEQSEPRVDADASDERIAKGKRDVQELRRIRAELEEILTAVSL